MAERKFETTAAFKELIDLIRDGDALFLEGPRAVDDASVLEGYRWLTEILSVALDCYLWADEARPTVVPIVGPTRKFGGDNADAMYTLRAPASRAICTISFEVLPRTIESSTSSTLRPLNSTPIALSFCRTDFLRTPCPGMMKVRPT